MKTFVIIDGNAIIHRAYHALPPLTVKDGTQVNAVFGFTSMLLKIIHDIHPDYLAVSFDVAGKTFRDDLYEKYKATRVKADDALYAQIPLVYDVVTAFNIPIFTKEGFEADDVIATMSARVHLCTGAPVRVIIVTGDQDLLQLVDDDITEVYLLRKGMSDFHLYNEQAVKEKFGFGPEHIVDYKALRGDTSDNIPGVKGIGEKTAKELIEKIGGVEYIYVQIRNPKSEIRNLFSASVVKKLEEGEQDARMSAELATVRRDVLGIEVVLDLCKTHDFDREQIVALLKKFEFYSLVKRIPGGDAREHGSTGAREHTKRVKKKKVETALVEKETIVDFFADIHRSDVFACRAIIEGGDPLSGKLFGFVFTTKRNAWHVDLARLNEKETAKIFDIFLEKEKIIVGHDLKQLVKVLRCSGAPVLRCRLFDIMVASYVLNSSTRAHDLSAIVLRELGEEVLPASAQGNLFGADIETIAAEDALALRIHDIYAKKLHEEGSAGLFETVEMALIPVLADMELNGIAIDSDMLNTLSSEAASTIHLLEKKIWKAAGKEFNVSSSVQLRDILFDDLGLPKHEIKKGKTGYSTAASELEKLHDLHPIIPLIEEYREIEKLRNTYIDVLPTLVNKKTGRIHTTFNQTVAATGRLSSSDPNLQNIPIRTDLGKRVRDAFVAEKGHVLIAADYSQFELRIVASLAKDAALIDIFKRGEDVHAATAAVIHGVVLQDVTKEMRRAAKAVNFGVLYGMGAFGLARGTGLTQWEAQEFIETYFEKFFGVKKFMDETRVRAKKQGYVETLFGRRRYIPELASSNAQLRAAGERMAINMPIQGTQADLIKMAMIAVHKKIEKAAYETSEVQMILQVHDELVFEVKKGLEKEVATLVKKEMEGVATLLAPIEVDVHIGTRWGEMK